VVEWVALEHAACIAIVDGGTERGHLLVVVPLIAELECVDAGANHILDAPGTISGSRSRSRVWSESTARQVDIRGAALCLLRDVAKN